MTRRKSYREDQGARYFSSNSSDCSFCSESDVESCDSDVSSDSLELGLSGTSEAQQKFKRLRRIFLNRPTKAKKKERRRRNVGDGDTSEVDGRLAKNNVSKRRHSTHHQNSDSSNSNSSGSDTRVVNTFSKPVTGISSARPLQVAIEQHTSALWEQMKRHSAQRDSTANQVQSMLEQAVDELQFLKKQEERALESQVRLIRESYALRLEVLQQQYLNTVAEIEDEMYTSIQKRQEECDATILAAAKKLQDQTQRELLKDLAIANNEPIKEQLDSSSFSTASSSASHSKVHRHRNGRSLRQDPLSSPEQAARIPPIVKQVSPVSQQRAKLHALEEKLAVFSPESLHRVKNELATPIRRSKAERPRVKPKWTQTTPSIDQNHSPNKPDVLDFDEWRASPLSPLRDGPSYWRNGISLEARDREDRSDGAGGSSKSEHVDDISNSKTRRNIPASLMSQRFLRPEEEEELRHLRTSIGLAKDWMAKSSHT